MKNCPTCGRQHPESVTTHHHPDNCKCGVESLHAASGYNQGPDGCVWMSTSVSAPPATDPVNPTHYQGDYVMRVIEDFGLDFLAGTVTKYVLRAGRKDAADELNDLKKARWYLDRKIANIERTGRP